MVPTSTDTHSRPAWLTGVLLVLALALAFTGCTTSETASAAPQPPAPTVAPAGLEALAAYVPASSCTPKARPGTAKLGSLLVRTYPGTSYGAARSCPSTPSSEHHDGRAVDWMNSVRNAKQKKQARSLDSACHRNHMHISLSWAGAMGRTSYWSGAVAAPDYGRCRPADLSWATGYRAPNPVPCPRVGKVKAPKGASKTLRTIVTYSGREMSLGSTYGAVRAVQKAIGAKQTGTYSAANEKKMRSWQAAHHVKVTGKVSYATWRALMKAPAP